MTASAAEFAAPGHVFRAYDIRGVADTEITETFAWALGRAFSRFLRDSVRDVRFVALGRDNRPSSPRLYAALREGLLSEGVTVRDIGLSSSPLVGFSVCRYQLDGGVCVTGSHNSPANNGFKLEGRAARPLAESDIARLRLIMTSALNTDVELRRRGQSVPLWPHDDYLRTLAALVNVVRPLKVVVDAGNGVMGLLAPALLKKLGCTVVKLYCEPDSTFPHHIPNPEDPGNMRDLQEVVVESHADLGIAFDGDGDRLGVVDETGAIFSSAQMLMVLARDFLQRAPGASVLVDVKSSRTVLEDIQAQGGVPILTRTGHSLIRRRMADEGLLLGGEDSGHLFSAEGYYGTSDALLAATRLIGSLSKSAAPLSRLLGRLPQRYSSGLIELPVSENEKAPLVEMMTRRLSEQYRTVTIDGVRVEFDDGWALVRASNTGARLTLRFEADTRERLIDIQNLVESMLDAAR